MWFFYFLPMLVAVGFLLARMSRGGSLTAGANWRQVAGALLAVLVLGASGLLFAGLPL